MPNHMIQENPLSTDDLTQYRGQWVALRDGRVVDSSDDASELRRSDLVEVSDILLLVPSDSSSAVFL